MNKIRSLQWYHSQADLIWPDGVPIKYSTTACQPALLVFVSSWCVVLEPMEFNHRLPCLSRPSQKKRHAWSLQKSAGKKETLENMCFV